ncbi:MAG: SOS response-associated peptidase [Verrucomicrobiae bacterium]|nr:SOS response-associated peptidase [Verrucomicrobiae bacterium]
MEIERRLEQVKQIAECAINGEPVFTFAILTRAASPALAEVRDRMPVVLDPSRLGQWLYLEGDAYRDALAAPLLDGFQFYPVSRAVNSPRHNAPDCLKPLDTP